MEFWQQQYLSNIARINAIRRMPEADSPEALEAAIGQCDEETRLLALENAQLIRENLFPVLGAIAWADDETITQLKAFAAQLTSGSRPDNNLALHIHEALLVAARNRHDRDFLIQELYECGLWSFYLLDSYLTSVVPEKFRRKIRLYFREGASYLRIYDDIKSTETRGYIHRCMGNIALSYSQDDALPKLETINASIRVLTDPVYHEKTPDLPWDRFILASHQERSTLLQYLRSVEATPEVATQVMESAQIIRNAQEERARREGHPLEARWQYVYACAMFFCGVTDIRTYLDSLLEIQEIASREDISSSGMFANANLTAYFMDALATYGASVRDEYSDRATKMLRQSMEYLHLSSKSPNCGDLRAQVSNLFQAFLELPGGVTLRELFHSIAPLAKRELYIHSFLCGKLSRFIVQLAIKQAPELLAGLPGTAEDQLQLSEDAGLFHDIGMLLFSRNQTSPLRLSLQNEDELRQQHTICGKALLSRFPSVASCAWAAFGHHRTSSGYPKEYQREQDPTPILTDIIVLSDVLSRCASAFSPDLSPRPTMEQCLTLVQENPDGCFHPGLAALILANADRFPKAIRDMEQELYTHLWENQK